MSAVSDDERDGSDTAAPAPGNSFTADLRVSVRRWLVKSLRNPFVTFSSLVQPVIFFVLMAEVFGAVVGGALAQSFGSDVNYVTYLTPAIVIQSTLAAAAVSGIGVVDDMESGMFDTILVSPMRRSALFLGNVLSEVTRITVQTSIILALGYVMLLLDPNTSTEAYLQTGVPGFVGVLLVTIAFGGVFMAYSNVVALVTRDREATILIANLLTFPLLFISSAFVPLGVLPGWIQSAATVNPITYGVDGIRAVMLGRDVLTVFDVTAFPGLWNTVVPVAAVLVGLNIVLGGVAVHLLRSASGSDVR